MRSHKRPVPSHCCIRVDGIRCTKPAWVAGRCAKHARELREADPAEFERIGNLSTDERERLFYFTANPLPPKWEYENPSGEEYLAGLAARRQRYLDTHDNVPLLLTFEELDDLIVIEEQELIDALEAQDRESQLKSTEEADHGTGRDESN